MPIHARQCAIILTIVVIVLPGHTSASAVRIQRDAACPELPETVLKDILGAAFNSRYMSVTPPAEDDAKTDEGMKRESNMVPSFYVGNDFAQELGRDEPAWSLSHLDIPHSDHTRVKRKVPPRQWECESKIAWVDLGPDYYPRYLRSVECTSKNCWYGHYVCKPRSFTVKILKRRKGQCVSPKPGTKVGVEGLPKDLLELWVWEERAVNFCCDCSL